MSPLPNPGMDFTPFDTLPAASLDEMVENIEALADGSGLDVSSIVPNALMTGTGTSWAWVSWTPTLSNMSVGNGTLNCKRMQVGKIVFFNFSFILGSTSSVSSGPSFTLPVTSVSPAVTNSYIGQARLQGTDVCPGAILHNSTTTAAFIAYDSNATFPRETAVTSTVPFTWTTNHALVGQGFYVAA